MEPQPPVWVFKRDGRQVPFEADKISRALFAATEALGRPDAFLARELTDGVVHFLASESEEATPTTAQVAEVVAKVVRELGQPALAETFVEHGRRRERTSVQTVATTAEREKEPQATSPRASREIVLRFDADTPLVDVLPACTRGYTLQAVFARDIVAAHEDGLLTLAGLETPCELAGCVLGRPGAVGLATEIERLRRFVGRYVVLDGPEHGLARAGRTEESAARDYVRELEIGLRISGLDGVVNLNVATPPSWADDLAEGPLFTEQRHSPGAGHLTTLADVLARESTRPDAPTDRVRIDWHVGERDFLPGNRDRLEQMARLALEWAAICFAFDRPRKPIYLAEGIDRGRPAALLTVGAHLPRLAAQPGVNGDAEVFLQKLGSLARLALSAGVQKREFLRRLDRARSDRSTGEPAVTNGFLLDRARLVVAPVGLDAVTETFTGRGLSSGGAALDFAKRVVQRLRDVLRQDGRAAHLDTCLDGPFGFRLGDKTGESSATDAAGLTAWDAAAPVKSQLRAAGPLHALAEGGTLALFVPAGQAPTAENVVEWLRAALQQSDVARLRLVRSYPEHRQLTFNG